MDGSMKGWTKIGERILGGFDSKAGHVSIVEEHWRRFGRGAYADHPIYRARSGRSQFRIPMDRAIMATKGKEIDRALIEARFVKERAGAAFESVGIRADPNVRAELANVVNNYPLEPGDTISHKTALSCSVLGWITRDAGGNWIPTAAGVAEHVNAKGKTDD